MHLPLARCTLRSWQADDAERLSQIANDRSVWIMVRDRFPHPYTLDDAHAFIARVTAEVPERNFAIAQGDVVMGGVNFMPGDDIHRVQAEVGYWVAAEARGRGLATEAVRGLVAWLWEHTDFQHLTANVFTYNPESARVLEKVGFTLGHLARKNAIKEGRLHDSWLYQFPRPDR